MVDVEGVIRRRMKHGMVLRRTWMGLTIEAAQGTACIRWVKLWRRHVVPSDTWPMYVGRALHDGVRATSRSGTPKGCAAACFRVHAGVAPCAAIRVSDP